MSTICGARPHTFSDTSDDAVTDLAHILFLSDVRTGSHHARTRLWAIIESSGLDDVSRDPRAARVAQAYGDYPDTSPARMRWALDVVSAVYDMYVAHLPMLHPPAREMGVRSSAVDWDVGQASRRQRSGGSAIVRATLGT